MLKVEGVVSEGGEFNFYLGGFVLEGLGGLVSFGLEEVAGVDSALFDKGMQFSIVVVILLDFRLNSVLEEATILC